MPTTSSPRASSRATVLKPMKPAAPVTRVVINYSSAPDAVIGETRICHFLGRIDIAQIDEHRRLQQRANPRQIERAISVPFGDDGKRIGAGDRFIGIVEIADVV